VLVRRPAVPTATVDSAPSPRYPRAANARTRRD